MLPTGFLTTELLTELVKEGGRSTFLELHATELAAEVIRLRADGEKAGEELAYWKQSFLDRQIERDAARKEATELRARINAALEILDDPSDESDGICRATEALWGKE